MGLREAELGFYFYFFAGLIWFFSLVLGRLWDLGFIER